MVRKYKDLYPKRVDLKGSAAHPKIVREIGRIRPGGDPTSSRDCHLTSQVYAGKKLICQFYLCDTRHIVINELKM